MHVVFSCGPQRHLPPAPQIMELVPHAFLLSFPSPHPPLPFFSFLRVSTTPGISWNLKTLLEISWNLLDLLEIFV